MTQGGLARGRMGLLVLHGDPPSEAELASVEGNAFIVAADGGANALADAGVWPDILVGDLESVRPAVLAEIRDRRIPVEEHPREKADIDGLLALERLLAEQPDSVVVLGALGGRSAMAFAHLEILRRCLASGVPAHILAAGETLSMARGGEDVRVLGDGRVFNVLPDSRVATFSIAGSEYDAASLSIPFGSSRGLSNEVRGAVATIHVTVGRVLVVVEPLAARIS